MKMVGSIVSVFLVHGSWIPPYNEALELLSIWSGLAPGPGTTLTLSISCACGPGTTNLVRDSESTLFSAVAASDRGISGIGVLMRSPALALAKMHDRGLRDLPPSSSLTDRKMPFVDESDVEMSDAESFSSQKGHTNSGEAISAEGDLGICFHNAVKGFLDFKGSFYHHSAHSWPAAPDPEMNIEGVGQIALPLTEKDAQAIIARASQAPFGKGSDTVVDTSVRDTWEIEPAKVSFGNGDWVKFVDKVASQDVWKSLGVAPFDTPPRCDLHKLLLYQTGSHFLPHQDSSKAEGMFATVVIVLPCDFEGGEVHVSHGGKSAVLDVAADAADCKFSVLAWYTDVVHEVKPVKSGYRLALSYNLIHSSPSLSLPRMPDVDALQGNLRHVLQMWSKGEYKTRPKVPFLAYILSHQYSAEELKKGKACLKRADAYLIDNLVPVARDLDFSVYLAHLTRTVKGDADEERKDGRYVMANVEEDIKEISKPVCISSDDPFKVGYFEVQDDSLFPKDYFESAYPDEEDFEGYTGNVRVILSSIVDIHSIAPQQEGAPLEQQYLCSVVFLFRNADKTAVVTRVKGLPWVLRHQESKGLNLDIRSAVSTALDFLKESEPKSYYDRGPSLLDGAAQSIVSLALEWKDGELWGEALNLRHLSTEEKEKNLAQGIELFELNSIRPALLQYVTQYTGYNDSFKSRLDAIKKISEIAGNKASSQWVDELTRDALTAYGAPKPSDAETLASLAYEKGLDLIVDTLIPNLNAGDEPKGDYRAFIRLAEALYKLNPSRESSSPVDSSVSDIRRSETIRRCLLESVTRQGWKPSTNWRGRGEQIAPVDRVQEIVDVCLSVQEPEPCQKLLSSLLDFPPDTDVAARFRDIYVPMISALKKTLEKHGRDVTSEPFCTFFKDLVVLYLDRILGTPESAPPLPRIDFGRLIEQQEVQGQEFAAFVNSPQADSIRISGIPKDKLYWFTRSPEVEEAQVKVTTELTDRLRKHYTLNVEKTPEELALYSWEGRRAAASAFLNSVGNEDKIKVIMGERYGDLKKLLDGRGLAIGGSNSSDDTA
ncbi:hypothetical protein NMY22_g2263 [Coprinellus aureogranulatus]|nr:hypothetical protein NMY22_g2263 [Coprinellus aureogranulatus]